MRLTWTLEAEGHDETMQAVYDRKGRGHWLTVAEVMKGATFVGYVPSLSSNGQRSIVRVTPSKALSKSLIKHTDCSSHRSRASGDFHPEKASKLQSNSSCQSASRSSRGAGSLSDCQERPHRGNSHEYSGINFTGPNSFSSAARPALMGILSFQGRRCTEQSCPNHRRNPYDQGPFERVPIRGDLSRRRAGATIGSTCSR
jgi:hypothetical protein